MYIFSKSSLRIAVACALAIAFFLIFKHPFTAFAADGSSANGAQLPDYNSGKEINVVDDYDADNTGMTDSTKAIQKALNVGKKKASDTYKVVVRIPKGTYSLSKGLTIYSNTQLIMDDEAVLRRDYEGGCILGVYNSGGTAGGYSGAHNILIQGGTIDGNTAEYGSTYGFSNVRLAHVSNIIFRNVSIINNKNGHHLEIGGASGITIDGCYFGGYTGSLLKEAIQIDVMNSSGVFAGYPPFDDTTCDNVLIKNCTFKSLPRAIGSHTAVIGHYYTNITIASNTFDNISDIALYLYNYKHCTISDNTMTSCGAGLTFNYMTEGDTSRFHAPVDGFSSATSLIDSDADLVIKNNSISTIQTNMRSEPFGIVLYGANITSATSVYPAYNYTMTNISISSNTIITAGSAISMTNVLDTDISSNEITTSSESGCVEKNLVFLSYCSGINIKKDSIKNSLKSAVRAENSSDITVSECTISSCSSMGIAYSAVSSGTISKNNFSSDLSGAVKITNASSKVTCSGNTIKDFGGYGIKIESSGSGKDIKLKSNDFSNGDTGISCVNEGRAYLYGNSFEAVTDKVYADSDGLITLVKPKNFVAEEVTEDKIKLTWNAVSEADGIEVYRCRAGLEEDFTLLATLDSGSIYQDERLYQGTNYIYKIVPYITVGDTSYQNTSSDEILTRTKINIESSYVDCISQAGFTSKPITPKFTVTVNSRELVSGTDYEYSYSDNISVGRASIVIVGKGDYSGTLTYYFDITIDGDKIFDAASRKDLGGSIFSVQSSRKYNVSFTQTDGMALAVGDTKLTSVQRSINAYKLQVPVSFKITTAIWTDGGYQYFVL